MHFTASQVFEFIVHFIFWCSIASLFMAVVQRSLTQYFPNSKAAQVWAFATDVVTKFGALNLKESIAPTPREEWTPEKRAEAQKQALEGAIK